MGAAPGNVTRDSTSCLTNRRILQQPLISWDVSLIADLTFGRTCTRRMHNVCPSEVLLPCCFGTRQAEKASCSIFYASQFVVRKVSRPQLTSRLVIRST